MTRAQQWALLVTVAILVLAFVVGQGGVRGGLGAVRTERSSAPLAGARALNVSITQGAGTLRVDTIDSENAYEAVFTHNVGIRVRADHARGRLRIRDERWRMPSRGFTNDWVIGISRRVPVELEVSTGAGRGTFDLTGLQGRAEIRAGAGEVRMEFRPGSAAVEELELQAGAGRFEAVGLGYAQARRIEFRAGVGEVRLDFAGATSGRTEVEINGGVGRIVLTVPEGVGVRVMARGGMTSRLNLAGFTSRGQDEYVNAAWDTAPARLEVRARLGVGEFEVRGP